MNLPTSKIGWRTREEDGMILTWDLPSGSERAPILSPELGKGMDVVERKWGNMCREVADEIGSTVPDGVCQAHIWRESGGNEKARNRENPADPTDDGIGLGQITSKALKAGRTDDQLFDPRTNIRVMSRYIKHLWERYEGDFCRVAAAYNAGSVRESTRNEWGMVMTAGHVAAEVAAFNWFLTQKMNASEKEAALAVAHQFTLFDLLPAREPLDTLPEGDEPA